MKPYILMPLAELNTNEGLARAYAMRRSYADLVATHGFVPLGIPTNISLSDIKDLYNNAAGILLMGGNDVDPRYYKEEKNSSIEPYDAARDSFEIDLVKQAAKDKKRLVGFCRGAQVLCVALGGSLYQDIADKVNEEIHASVLPRYEETINKEDIKVSLQQDSRLAHLLGKNTVNGPCNHHQAIHTLPDSLAAVGHSQAGIIEAVEAIDPLWFCFGIQSHPETRGGGDFDKLFNWKE